MSQYFSRVILEAAGAGSVVGADSLAARWRVRGDSIEVRWDDAVAVFPRGGARTVGRLELRGESRPLTVWRGCPGH